jgi:hypothetical protein
MKKRELFLPENQKFKYLLLKIITKFLFLSGKGAAERS